jgi:hypothetical protein
MNIRIPSLLILGTAALFGAMAVAPLHAQSVIPAGKRVVDGSKPVKSKKRGLCLNKVSEADFMAIAPSVSWFYTWHFTNSMTVPADAKIEFIPMAWGMQKETLPGLREYLASHPKPSMVLAINEPNLKGQSFITPEQTAKLFKDIKGIAGDIPVVGPNMSLGSPEGSSIKAMDPIEHKEITYTFQTPFLKAFFKFLGNDSGVAGIGSHSYGNAGELKWMVGDMIKTFKKPVYITEFADWHNKDGVAGERKYLIEAVDFMERNPDVHGYAWFKDRVKDNGKISILGSDGQLTPLGQAYINMPVHDPDVYYQVPGKFQAESFVAVEGALMDETTDTDGFLEMDLVSPSDSLDYNISVDQAGPLKVSLRFSAKQAAKFDILSGGKVLASIDANGTGWQTGTADIVLPAGMQTIRIKASSAVRFNWAEFARN